MLCLTTTLLCRRMAVHLESYTELVFEESGTVDRKGEAEELLWFLELSATIIPRARGKTQPNVFA